MRCPTLWIKTDHKPLKGILCDRALDTIEDPRIIRIKQRTLPWRFNIIHVPGKDHQAPDGFSRRNNIKNQITPRKIDDEEVAALESLRYEVQQLYNPAQLNNLRLSHSAIS